jgi:hypothetical protein
MSASAKCGDLTKDSIIPIQQNSAESNYCFINLAFEGHQLSSVLS